MEYKKKSLLFGYGNPDRGDDGAAYHLLLSVAKKFDKKEIDLFSSEIISLSPEIDVFFNFQLLPEHAEMVSAYQRVVFIDAHTGEINEEISFHPIIAEYKHSPFTHHFPPASCLAVAESLTGRYPKAWLLSIRGYQFGFYRDLSAKTAHLLARAVEMLFQEYL